MILVVASGLCFQLVYTSFFCNLIDGLEAAANKETQAKSIVATCERQRMQLQKMCLMIVAGAVVDNGERLSFLQSGKERAIKNIDDIERLTQHDNRVSEAFREKFRSHWNNFLRLSENLSLRDRQNPGTFTLSRFASDKEFVLEFQLAAMQLIKDEQFLMDIYEPVAADFSPIAKQRRAEAKFSAISALLIGSLLVIALIATTGRDILTRLNLLMNNIRRFSRGESALQAVSGTDELAELDAEFLKAAEARFASENMRRAMYGMVSHDMMSPLGSMMLLLSTVSERDRTLSEDSKKKIQRAMNETWRLERLCKGFLDLQLLETGTFELDQDEHGVEQIIDQSIESISAAVEPRALVVQKEVDKSLDCFCDRDRVIQVLINLLSNAVKFSPRNGRILVSARGTATGVRFEVSDEGPGIKPEDEERLFKAYSRGSQSEETRKTSHGLGLHICRQLVEAHGGTIGVRNANAGGSIFWFELPHGIST